MPQDGTLSPSTLDLLRQNKVPTDAILAQQSTLPQPSGSLPVNTLDSSGASIYGWQPGQGFGPLDRYAAAPGTAPPAPPAAPSPGDTGGAVYGRPQSQYSPPFTWQGQTPQVVAKPYWNQNLPPAPQPVGTPSAPRVAEGSGTTTSPNVPPSAAGTAGGADTGDELLMTPRLAGGVDWSDEQLQFRERIDAMWRAMPDALKQGTAVESGYRTYAQQQAAYDRYKSGQGGIAAPPGQSWHEKGLAADWSFANPAANQWMHANASKFGLEFPQNLRESDPNHMQLAASARATDYDIPLLQKTAYRLESDNGRDTRTSASGAVGPMQIKPDTFRQYAKQGEDINNPQDNINVGNRILADLYRRFGPPAGGDMDKVLLAYQQGEHFNLNTPFNQLPKEAQDYLTKAHKLWNDGAAIDVLNGTKAPPGASDAQARADALGQQRVDDLRRSLGDLQRRIDAADPQSAELHDMMRQAFQHSQELQRRLEETIFNPPKQDQTSVFGRFGSLATVIGIFGGMLGRRGMIGSLDAAGAAMEAINEGDYERYQQNFKLWDTQVGMMSKALDMQHTAYSEILEDAKLTDKEKWDRIHEQATIMQDRDMLLQLEQGNAQAIADRPMLLEKQHAELIKIQGEGQKAFADAAKASEEAGLQQNMGRWLDAKDKTDRDAYAILAAQAQRDKTDLKTLTDDPAQVTAARNEAKSAGSSQKGQPHSVRVTWSDGTSETLHGWPGPPGSGLFITEQGPTRDLHGATNVTPLTPTGAMASQPAFSYPQQWEGMKEGKPPPGIPEDIYQGAINYVQTGRMPALGMSSSQRAEINRAVPSAAHALGINPLQMAETWAKYQGYTSGQRALGTRAAALAVGIGEAAAAAPAVITTSQGVNNTDFPPINEFMNLGAYLTGSPEIVAFRTALNSFLNSYARAINPQGRMTDSQQNHAYEILNTNMAQGQLDRGVAQLLQELQYQRNGLQDAVETVGKLLQPAADARARQPFPSDIPPGSVEIGVYQGHRAFLTPQGKIGYSDSP